MARKDGSARLSSAEDRGRITPEISAVGEAAAAVRVLPLALVLRPCSCLHKCVDAKELAPLFEEALVFVAMRMAVSTSSIAVGGCPWRRVLAGIEGSPRGRECAIERGNRFVVHAEHVLICGHGAGHLEELDEQEHGYPHQLQGDPTGEEKCEGVGVNHAAESRCEDIALVRDGGIYVREI